MRKEKERNRKAIIPLLLLIFIIIIVIILLLSCDHKTVVFNGNGATQGEMQEIRLCFNKDAEIEDNQFVKEGYTFDGWTLHDLKTDTWRCEDGWYTIDEIKENSYTITSYQTEQVNELINSFKKGRIELIATWDEVQDKDSISEEVAVEGNNKGIVEEDTNKSNSIDVSKNNGEKVNKDTSTEDKKDEVISKDETEDFKECVTHNYISYITKSSTYEEYGIRKFVCTECDGSYEEIVDKLQYSDYQILEKKLIGKQIDVDKLGKEMDIEDLIIKTTEIRYIEKTEDGKEIIKNDITYNGNEYTISIDKNGIVIAVEENQTEKFKFGEPYVSNDDIGMIEIIYENGDLLEYNKDRGALIHKEEDFIKVYQNKIYYKLDEKTYELLGYVEDDGNSWFINDDDGKIEFKYDSNIEKILHDCEENYEIIEDKEATCTEAAKKVIRCALCKNIVTTYTGTSLGHDLSEWTLETEATCTENGTEVKTCSRCDYKESRDIEELGHDLSEWTLETEATCTENGIEVKTCSKCDYKESRDTELLEHEYKSEVIKEPTDTEKGTRKYTCEKCGDTYTEDIDIIIIDITGNIDDMRVGDTIQITAQSTSTDSTLSFKSSDESVVKVDSLGNVTAIGVGTANIIIMGSNGEEKIIEIEIKKHVYTITYSYKDSSQNTVTTTADLTEGEDALLYAPTPESYMTSSLAYYSTSEWAYNGTTVTEHIVTKDATLTAIYEKTRQYLYYNGAESSYGIVQGFKGGTATYSEGSSSITMTATGSGGISTLRTSSKVSVTNGEGIRAKVQMKTSNASYNATTLIGFSTNQSIWTSSISKPQYEYGWAGVKTTSYTEKTLSGTIDTTGSYYIGLRINNASSSSTASLILKELWIEY